MTRGTLPFALTGEQQEWRRVVREAFEQASPPSEVARLMETAEGFDRISWHVLADQLGLQAVAIPEEFGGAGYSFREVAIALEEMGRTLLCAPYFSSVVLASSLLLSSGDRAARERYLPSIAAGQCIATVAFEEPGGQWSAAPAETRAVEHGDGYLVTGRKAYVIDGLIADLIIVSARTDRDVGLFAVRGDAPGLRKAPLSTMDQTRKLAAIELADVKATRIGAGDAAAALARMFQAAQAGMAAEQVGGMRACLDLALEYAKTRLQFGRPIGSFQAVKHKLADMFVRSEQAASAAMNAAIAVAEGADDIAQSTAVAKAYCSDAYTWIAEETIQVHGGIGTTWEHPAHLFLKRAKSSGILFGTARYHRQEVAAGLGLVPPENRDGHRGR